MKSFKVVVSIVGLALVGTAAFLALLDTGTPKRNRYLIPDGYTGWLCITYGVDGKPPLPTEDGYRVVRFDQSGIVETSTKGVPGKLKDEFLVYSKNGVRPLHAAREMGGGGTMQDASAPSDIYTYRFWISPNAQRDTPPPGGSTCGPWRSSTVAADCDALDTQAIRLAGARKLDEAAAAMDRAIASCPTSVSRMRSRGVLYAAMGDRQHAERVLDDAIKLSDRRGDRCEADLTQAELAVIQGGQRLEAPPKSCNDEHSAMRDRQQFPEYADKVLDPFFAEHVMVNCVGSRSDDTPFTFTLVLDGEGHAVRTATNRETPRSKCLAGQAARTKFPTPPKAPFTSFQNYTRFN